MTHAVHCSLEFEPGALLTSKELFALLFRVLAFKVLADVIADGAHHFEQRRVFFLRMAREELHHAENFFAQLDRKAKSGMQTGFFC